MSTRTKEYTLNIGMSSTEGTHDFIRMLEIIIDDIKGGVEKNTAISERQKMGWKIDVTLEEYDQGNNK